MDVISILEDRQKMNKVLYDNYTAYIMKYENQVKSCNRKIGYYKSKRDLIVKENQEISNSIIKLEN